MGWFVAAVVLTIVAFLALRPRRGVARAELERCGERAAIVAARLGFRVAEEDRKNAITLLRGELRGATAEVRIGCHPVTDWVILSLQGRRWLPEGFVVRGPMGSGPDPLERERPNFCTDSGLGLVVTPVERFIEASSPWGALARAIALDDPPRVTDTTFVVRAKVASADDVIAFIEREGNRADAWCAATSALDA